MLINYYEDGGVAPVRTSRLVVTLMMINALFSIAIVFAWTYVALILSEPIAWATWMPVSRGFGLAGVLEYPFVMLWSLPLLGVLGAWLSMQAGRKTLAYAFVGVPLVMLALVMGWYYLTPGDWH
ncbi:MAG: hypothetical protein AB7L90_23065 [Hyphomicrobiaceae bacterium]